MVVSPPIALTPRVLAALLARLKNDATLQGLMGQRWSEDAVPAGTVWVQGSPPVLQLQGLVKVLAAPNTYLVGKRRQQQDLVILVRGVVQAPSYTPLIAVADRLLVLLHGWSGPLSAGRVRSSVALEEYRQAERTDGLDYRHLGHRFRVRAQD